MSTTTYLRHAQRLLEAALKEARHERDRGIFEMARGQRSLQELLRLIERVALVRTLMLQSQAVISTEDVPLAPSRFRPGEHWRSEQGLYRVEACPLIPSCVRLRPVDGRPQAPLYRHPSNTSRFQRLRP